MFTKNKSPLKQSNFVLSSGPSPLKNAGAGGKVPAGQDAGHLEMEVRNDKVDYSFRKIRSTK